MIEMNYPAPDFRTRTEGGRRFIFDRIRKTWLLLTPEEWVRQNFVQYLLVQLNYPASFMALEKEIKLHELRKRFDLLVYDPAHRPWMLVECKEPTVPLSEDVLQQVLRYHASIPVDYLIITNGEHTIGWKKEDGLHQIKAMPAYPFI